MLIADNYINLYTLPKQASQIIYILKKYCELEDTVIVDATAGVGGNCLYFCKYFKYVYCIDINTQCIPCLEHNLKNYDNKFIINEDCLDVLKIISYDIIFIDPPWGGNDYKYIKDIQIYLCNKNIKDIIESLYFKCKLIALKVPTNFNEYNENSLWKIKIYSIYKNNNYTIIFKLIIYYK